MLKIHVIDHNFRIYFINTLNNQFSLRALSILLTKKCNACGNILEIQPTGLSEKYCLVADLHVHGIFTNIFQSLAPLIKFLRDAQRG